MDYKKILSMVASTAYNEFIHGLDYDGLKSTVVECATKIYIKQMELEKEKLQQEYDELCEGHDKLSYDWAQLKKENRELNKKYNELLGDFNRINSEPLLRKMTIAELKERGFLRNESK